MNKEEIKTLLKDNWKNILLVVFGLVIIALIMSTTCTRQKLDKAENNITALTDSIHTYQLKNGELMYEKQGFIAEKSELEKYIGIKEKEIKDIEKQLKSALATIAKLMAEVHIDTIHTVDSVVIKQDGVYDCLFTYKDPWLSLDGVTKVQLNPFQSHTIINNIGMELGLTVGTTKDNKWLITTDNPNVHITSINGANLDKAKPKRWTFGIQGGLGLVGGVGLVGTQFKGITTANTGAGWFVGAGGYIGFGFSYKLFEF